MLLFFPVVSINPTSWREWIRRALTRYVGQELMVMGLLVVMLGMAIRMGDDDAGGPPDYPFFAAMLRAITVLLVNAMLRVQK